MQTLSTGILFRLARALKEIIRAWGLNPEEILTRDAIAQPHMTIIDQKAVENHQISQLARALRQQMLKEIRESSTENSINSNHEIQISPTSFLKMLEKS